MKVLSSFIVLVLFVFGLSTCTNNKEEILYNDSVGTCDTINVTYAAKVKPILVANCLSCHGNAVAASNGGGLKFQDYADVKANANQIYGSVAHLPGYASMPKNMSSTIDNCQIKIIRKWVQSGALDN